MHDARDRLRSRAARHCTLMAPDSTQEARFGKIPKKGLVRLEELGKEGSLLSKIKDQA